MFPCPSSHAPTPPFPTPTPHTQTLQPHLCDSSTCVLSLSLTDLCPHFLTCSLCHNCSRRCSFLLDGGFSVALVLDLCASLGIGATALLCLLLKFRKCCMLWNLVEMKMGKLDLSCYSTLILFEMKSLNKKNLMNLI